MVKHPMDFTPQELDALYEKSKDDRFIIVGSVIRQLIGMIQRLQEELEKRNNNG